MCFNLAVVSYNFFAKRLLISYKNLNIVAVTQLKHLANNYPILRMENISQVLLFSKYCLTLLCLLDHCFGENALNLGCDIYTFPSIISIQNYLGIFSLKQKGHWFFFPFLSFILLLLFLFFNEVYSHPLKHTERILKKKNSWGLKYIFNRKT